MFGVVGLFVVVLIRACIRTWDLLWRLAQDDIGDGEIQRNVDDENYEGYTGLYGG